MLLRFVCTTCLCLLIVDGVQGKIVFSSSRPRLAPRVVNEDNIYVMNSDGSSLTRLTHNARINIAPVWAPNGRQIAFVSTRDKNWEIYVMDADGSNPWNLTRHPGWDLTPSWHPDGNRIAFKRFWDGVGLGDRSDIYAITVDGRNVKKIVENAYNPQFSPDGQRIAFQGDNDQIFVANADGTNPWLLSDEKDLELGGWSPDSRQILYSQPRGQPDPWLLFIVTVDPVFDGNQGFPKKKIRMPIRFADATFGADGKSILFSGHGGAKRWHIYRLYIESERFIQLTFGEFVDYYPQEWKSPLSVSPPGKVPLLWGEIKEN